MIDETPDDQDFILTGKRGRPWGNPKTLSSQMAQVKRDLGLRDELHFHDARGFCVTRLVRAGATLDEIARHMGWSPSWAVKMLDVYASMMGTDSSALLARLGDDGAPKV